MKIPLFVFFLFLALPAFTQQDTAKLTVPKDTLTVTEQLTARQLKQLYRQHRRDSIRAHKKVWLSILGGPSYNPEASLGIGGAMLMTFRMNKYDKMCIRDSLYCISQSFPIGILKIFR